MRQFGFSIVESSASLDFVIKWVISKGRELESIPGVYIEGKPFVYLRRGYWVAELRMQWNRT